LLVEIRIAKQGIYSQLFLDTDSEAASQRKDYLSTNSAGTASCPSVKKENSI
jgi:hypothetical protein